MSPPALHIEPRLLTARQAAAYLNMPITEVVRQAIGRLCFGTRVLYDRAAMDVHLDHLSGLASGSTLENDDPEIAFARFTSRFSPAARRP
jgi:hypothetical protein